MTYKIIKLKKGKTESLKRWHPWIFSGAIKELPFDIEEGECVRIEDSEENFLAIGYYQRSSIAIRILSFNNIEINSFFWKKRLRAAYQLRDKLQLKTRRNSIYRLIHGEGDFIPGLIIDIYDTTAVIQAHSIGIHKYRMDICNSLIEIMGDKINSVYYKSETTLPSNAKLIEKEGFLYGTETNNIALENGLYFYIDWLKGQKTGFFIDQRENRALVEKYSLGKDVLNMFCYTGGFSVYAMRGGANKVCSIDSSEKAIELTCKNIKLNFNDISRHEAHTEDAFKFLTRSAHLYDLIILDPPAFAKHKDTVKNAIKGYTRLNFITFSKIKKGGIVFTFSCSQAITKEQFRLVIFTAAAQAKRKVRILHQLHQPSDHPINIYHPEGEYLKGFVLQIE